MKKIYKYLDNSLRQKNVNGAYAYNLLTVSPLTMKLDVS